jgi:hypothetical protein
MTSSSFVVGSTLAPQTNTTQHDCDWSKYPVVVPASSDVFLHKETIVAILDSTLQSPTADAGLDVLSMCQIAKTINDEFVQALQNYNDQLKNATHLDKGRDRQVTKTVTLSICSTYEKLVEEFIVAYKYDPNWWDKIWISIRSLFTTRTANEVALVRFENEYSDAHRREWMAEVVADEKKRVARAIHLIEQGAYRCAQNIQDARTAGSPVHHQDLVMLSELIRLYQVLKPEVALQVGDLGVAQNFLTGGD